MIEDAIMQNIKSNLITNESVKYEPNQLLAQVIGDYITGMGFYYGGFINEPNSDETGISVNLNVELNGDDVDVMVSPNVMYCFINAQNIDYKIETSDNSIYDIPNFSDILAATRFTPVHDKVWRDDKNLYLLKINLNTGKIGRYDWRVGRFTNQDINWNSSTPEEVVELLLTKEYLEDYFQHELCSLESYVSFASRGAERLNEAKTELNNNEDKVISMKEIRQEAREMKQFDGCYNDLPLKEVVNDLINSYLSDGYKILK